jgi:hypothetical protein
MEYRTYLLVPFAQTDAVKALGAEWDPAARKWYVPEGVDVEPFRAWSPLAEVEGQLHINGALFVAESRTTCLSCKDETPVIALTVEMLDETGEPYLTLLTAIEELPSDLSSLLARRYPFFTKGYSQFEERECVMNHCRCGARLEDFVLQSEPGECFFPMSPEEGMRVLLRPMPVAGGVVLRAGYAVSTENFIGLYAARRSFEA